MNLERYCSNPLNLWSTALSSGAGISCIALIFFRIRLEYFLTEHMSNVPDFSHPYLTLSFVQFQMNASEAVQQLSQAIVVLFYALPKPGCHL